MLLYQEVNVIINSNKPISNDIIHFETFTNFNHDVKLTTCGTFLPDPTV